MQVQHQFALKENFMKIEFENVITRLSFLCRLPDIKIAWINHCIWVVTVSDEAFGSIPNILKYFK